VVQVTDDGGGIDPARVRAKAVAAKLVSPDQASRMSDRELVNLVFLPGFSTADRVTQFSGRGVGMDVVRTNIEKIGGTVDVESRLGLGTTVMMKIPLTLAIIPALVVTCAGDRYCVPQVSLIELVRLDKDQVRTGIEWVHGAPVYRLRGNLLPLVYLDRELRVGRDESDGRNGVKIVVLHTDDRPFGLVVDEVHDTEEIVVKPLQPLLKGIPAFSGATILGDGRVALILDVQGLALQAGVVNRVRERTMAEKAIPVTTGGDRQTVLVFALRDGNRIALPLAVVDRLEVFPRSAVERVGTRAVVQYRGEIMPLVRLTRGGRRRPARSRSTRRSTRSRNGAVQVVVLAGEGRRAGLLVHRIIDILDVPISAQGNEGGGKGVSAVIQGRATEFVNVHEVVRLSDRAHATLSIPRED
jgi:two-component system chemotaxis sensor kinase CheA